MSGGVKKSTQPFFDFILKFCEKKFRENFEFFIPIKVFSIKKHSYSQWLPMTFLTIRC
jgi:hypothetical protein